MMVATFITVIQNRSQVKELKRQWDSEHKPYLTCLLVTYDNSFRLCVTNSANVVAKDVHISIQSCLDQEPLRFERLKTFFERQSFLIPPNQSIYFALLISAYCDEDNLPKGYIEVSLSCEGQDFGTFQLYPSNHAYVIYDKERTGSDIKKSIDELNKTIKNKKFL